MTLTGIPVTVQIFQWLAESASRNSDWFKPEHHHHDILRNFCRGDIPDVKALDSDSQDVIYNFSRWLSILFISFDGGVSSSNVRSFSPMNDDPIRIVWDNGIAYSLSVTGWDRQTRKAVDYIFSRTCSIDRYSKDFMANRDALLQVLTFYEAQLAASLTFASQSLQFDDIVDQVDDESLMFMVLSAVPSDHLHSFYLDLSTEFSDDLAISVVDQPIFLRLFFSKPSPSEYGLLNKVKMHYNLQLYSQLDASLMQIITNKTRDFIKQCCLDPTVTTFIQDQLSQISEMQLRPRIQLLQLVIDQFFKDQ